MTKRKAAKTDKNPLKLNLACGKSPHEGFVGVDISADCNPDVVFDLTQTPWPWEDNSVEEAFCSHFFEHLHGGNPLPNERTRFMDELWRVLKPGGTATIITPYWASMRAVQDPSHSWPPICDTSYLYYNKAWRELNGLDHYPIVCDFDFNIFQHFDGSNPSAWHMREETARNFAVRHHLGVVADIQANLVKRSA